MAAVTIAREDFFRDIDSSGNCRRKGILVRKPGTLDRTFRIGSDDLDADLAVLWNL